ncbi:DinB family protein [Bacillus horti]|uniref:Damage-inducible protein DinB n=1 Tax=Caldalkalibacillus horti TaxID=77523 RepID=A0ABT9W077_9BACI|nr:DinB family protein [Bacillus horti]MDQ0166659.1 putative damage-inducible protein DinB [Bacillus horti]
MLFPYRNDVRKVLLPYLEKLDKDLWYRTSSNYPNSVAWVVLHIAQSEDHWVNKIGNKSELLLPDLVGAEREEPANLIHQYIKIREYTDRVLQSLSEEELDMEVEVPIFADGWVPPSAPTWRWLFHHVYTHEAYHVGQIGVIARINGFRGPLF